MRRLTMAVMAGLVLGLVAAPAMSDQDTDGRHPGCGGIETADESMTSNGRNDRDATLVMARVAEWLGCGDAEDPAPSCDPCVTVLAVTPSDGATDVNLRTSIAITFSHPIDLLSLSGPDSIVVEYEPWPEHDSTAPPVTLSGLVMSEGDTVATFTPVHSLDFGVYTLTLAGGIQGVQGADGDTMEDDFVWTFTTAEPDGTCIDRIDNDLDGFIDWDDPSCAGGGPEGS